MHFKWNKNGRVLTIYAALQAHQLARDPQQARGESRDIMLVCLSFGQRETVPNDNLMLLQYPPPRQNNAVSALRCNRQAKGACDHHGALRRVLRDR